MRKNMDKHNTKSRINAINNVRGITLITLVITIIVLLILASVATYTGMEAIDNTKRTTFIAELKIMQTHVNQWYEDLKPSNTETKSFEEKISDYLTTAGATKVYENDNFTDTKAKATFETSKLQEIVNESEYPNFFLISTDACKKNLGIEGVEQAVMVNVTTRKVVSYLGLKYKNEMYYTLEANDLNTVYNVEYTNKNIGNVGFSVKYNYIENGLARVTIPEDSISYEGYNKKWKVKYRLNDGPWNTSEDLNFIINEYGNYEIGLYNDNISQNIIANTWKGEILSKSQKINKSIGQTVNYTENSGKVDSWRLFYASDDEVFLISSNVVSSKDAFSPDGTNTYGIPLAPRGKYSWDATNSNYSYTNESDKYSGASNIFSTNYGKIYNQNWWNATQNETPDTQVRSKAAAFLCDSSNWTEYKAGVASYAVGGPTKELLVRSWFASGQSEDSLETLLADTTASNAGYEFDKPSALRVNEPIQSSILKENGTGKGLYNAGNAYWLDSSISGGGNLVCAISSESCNISYSNYNSIHIGVRPLVSIPMSKISITENENEGVVTTVVSINNN